MSSPSRPHGALGRAVARTRRFAASRPATTWACVTAVALLVVAFAAWRVHPRIAGDTVFVPHAPVAVALAFLPWLVAGVVSLGWIVTGTRVSRSAARLGCLAAIPPFLLAVLLQVWLIEPHGRLWLSPGLPVAGDVFLSGTARTGGAYLSHVSVLVRPSWHGPFGTHYRVVARGRHPAAPVWGPDRPPLRTDGWHRVTRTPDGVWGVASKWDWILIWDAEHQRRLYPTDGRHPPLAILLGPDDVPAPGAVDAMIDSVEWRRDQGYGRDMAERHGPRDASLVEALTDRRPAVRAAAERIVRAGGERMYPSAAALLDAR